MVGPLGVLWRAVLPPARLVWFEDGYFAYVHGRGVRRHDATSGERTWLRRLPPRLTDHIALGRRSTYPPPEWRLGYADSERIYVLRRLGFGFGTARLTGLRALVQESGAVLWEAPEGAVGDEDGLWIEPEAGLIRWRSMRAPPEEGVLDLATGRLSAPVPTGLSFTAPVRRDLSAHTDPYSITIEDELPYLVRRGSTSLRLRLVDQPAPRRYWQVLAYRRRIRHVYRSWPEPSGLLASIYIGPRYLLVVRSTEQGLCIQALDPDVGSELSNLLLPDRLREPSIDEFTNGVLYVSGRTLLRRLLVAVSVRLESPEITPGIAGTPYLAARIPEQGTKLRDAIPDCCLLV